MKTVIAWTTVEIVGEEHKTTARKHTRQRSAVENALAKVDGFRSAQDIFADLRADGEGVGLSTVYRQLKALADDGKADVVHNTAGEAQYRLCGENQHAEAAHHHHVVCRECGYSVEIEAPEVEAWAEKAARTAGFTDVTHVVDVFGLCAKHASA